MTEPIPTDLWGIAIPTWVGAVGSIGASLVAVWAVVTSKSARSGVESIRSGLNTDAENKAEERAEDVAESRVAVLDHEDLNDIRDHARTVASAALSEPNVRWRLLYTGKNRYALLNDSATTAHVRSVKDVSDGYQDALVVLTEPPVVINPGSQVLLGVHKSFASPAVTAVELKWTEGHNGRIRSGVFYI